MPTIKRSFAVIVPLFVCAILLGPLFADHHGKKKIKVLLIDGQNNHKWQETTPVMTDALNSCGKFEVTVSTAPGNKAAAEDWDKWDPKFSEYDAILSNYNGKLWPERVRNAFDKYVKDGGALVIVHAADNSFPEWKEYNEMIGLGGWGGRTEKHGPFLYVKNGKLFRDTSKGRGGSHGPQHEFNVDTYDSSHPIMKGFPPSWKHAKDELYDSLRGPAENVKVLATSYSPKSKKHEPMIMTINYGKGRVFHTPMGHAAYSMKCVGFYTVLQRGTEWAVTGDVTIPMPENFPTADQVKSK